MGLSAVVQRRVLRETTPELEHESLSQLIQGANKAWHGMKHPQPNWSDGSHRESLDLSFH